MLRLVSLLLLASSLRAAAPLPTNASPKITADLPFPSAVAWAKANKIPIDKIDPLQPANNVTPGDSVTVLVTLHEKSEVTQWFLYTTIAGPPKATNAGMTIHNNLGGKYEFPSQPTPVTLRTIGPFINNPKRRAPNAEDSKASFDLDKGFLGLGLNEAAAGIARIHGKKKQNVNFKSGSAKFSDEEIKKTKAAADAAEWTLSPAEQRAFGGTFPALLSYFNVVQHTESLAGILAGVVDRPSLLNLAVNLGIKDVGFHWQGARLSSLTAAAWGMSDDISIYEIPMVLNLNKHPSLNITMVVTAPRPPLLTSAGILGVLGEKPNKTEPYLTIRIISARLNSAPPK